MSGMRTWARWWFRAPDGRGYRRRQADAIMAAAGLGAVILCGAPVAGRLAGVALVAFAVALWSYLPSALPPKLPHEPPDCAGAESRLTVVRHQSILCISDYRAPVASGLVDFVTRRVA